jgi:hypothetical protein
MIRIGTTVRLKRRLRAEQLEPSGIAKVKAWLDDIEGGVRLDTRLNGFTFWNIKDLERAPAKKRKTRR